MSVGLVEVRVQHRNQMIRRTEGQLGGRDGQLSRESPGEASGPCGDLAGSSGAGGLGHPQSGSWLRSPVSERRSRSHAEASCPRVCSSPQAPLRPHCSRAGRAGGAGASPLSPSPALGRTS